MIGLLGAVLLIVAGAFGVTAVLDMSNPVVLVRYLTTRTSDLGNVFASRPLTKSSTPHQIPFAKQPFPDTVTWKGRQASVSDFLKETETNSFVVMCRGVQTHRWYRTNDDPDRTQSSWSVAKSFVGLVIGQLIDGGKLTEDTRLIDVLPEYETATEFDDITVGDLLDMSSGIDLNEDYSYFKPFWGVGGLQITTDLPSYVKKNRGMRFDPGEKFDYRSVDTQYLSMIAARVEDDTMTNILQRRIWEPLGMENDAKWNLDREDGTEKGFAGINATPRDFAKMGLLIANNGKVGDQQVVSEEWISRMTTQTVDAGDGWAYSAQWWQPPGHEEFNDLSALGVYGQYVYVNPEKQTVIVKLSDYDTERDEVATYSVFREFAEQCQESA